MTDNLYPEQGQAVVRALTGLGVRVLYPDGLHCCGLPALNSGDVRHGKWMARQTIRALERCDADYIVSGSASCVATLSQDYLHLFRDDPEWLAKAETLSPRVVDFTTFLDKVAQIESGSLLPRNGEGGTVTYHDSCQSLNALGIKEEPRRILREVLGAEISELPENNVCCGFGGSFSFEHPEIAERLMNRKLNNAESTGARTIVTDNQGCIMHLRGGCDASGRPLRVVHIAELLADRVRDLFGPQMA